MYALHEAGLAVNAPSLPATAGPPQGQVEPRAVESTEHAALETHDGREAVYTSSAAVLDLVRHSAESYAEMVAPDDGLEGKASTSGAYLGENFGQQVDVSA